MSWFKFKRLSYSQWSRLTRWEFWPVWIFYIPIVFYIFWLAIKYRGATYFSIANPKMEYGGIFGDDKSTTLVPLANEFPEAVPKTAYLIGDMSSQKKALKYFNIPFPIVLKPNTGYRGIAVKIIANEKKADDYLHEFEQRDTIAQEYIEGREYGVFYIREPNSAEGFVYSIVEKTFPEVIGDGSKTLERLILEHPRAVMMAPTFLKRHQESLNKVITSEESFQLVNIGSHCRGSLFLDANDLISNELSKALDKLLRAVPEFYFGRLDLRCPNEESLKKGQNLKIIEINGVTSEAASIYDPKHSLFNAYKVMFKQWDWAYRIGKLNAKRGFAPLSIKQILQRWTRGE